MDLRLSAQGLTLPELFELAAVELLDQLIEADSVGEALREKVMLEASNRSDLLREWMNVLIEMVRIQRMVFSRFHVLEIKGEGPLVLRAEMIGELIDPQRHIFKKRITRLQCVQASVSGGFQADIQLHA